MFFTENLIPRDYEKNYEDNYEDNYEGDYEDNFEENNEEVGNRYPKCELPERVETFYEGKGKGNKTGSTRPIFNLFYIAPFEALKMVSKLYNISKI